MRLFLVGLGLAAAVACAEKGSSGPAGGGDCVPVTFYPDHDADGFGDAFAEETREGCEGDDPPPGHVADGQDCDDDDSFLFPGAPETCDGVDEDCDGQVDEDPTDGLTWYPDVDGDSYGALEGWVIACTQPPGFVISASDCNDANADIYPWADEACDGVDNDCNGIVDDPDQLESELYYTDADGDGFGDPATEVDSCTPVPGTVRNGDDCEDADGTVFPGAEETCEDGVDQDCDGEDRACTTHWTEPFTWTSSTGQWCYSDALVYYAYFGETTFDECQTMANLTGTEWYVGEYTSYRYGWIGDHDATQATITSGSWTNESVVSRTSLYSCQLAVFDHRAEPTETPAEQIYVDGEGREWHYWVLTSQTHSQAVAFADDRGARIINPNSVGATGTAAFTVPTHWCHAGAQFNGSSYLSADQPGGFYVGFWN